MPLRLAKGCLTICVALLYVFITLGMGMDETLWRVTSGIVLFSAWGVLVALFSNEKW